MKRLLLFAITLSFLVPAGNAQIYSISDLGPLQPKAINSWAQIVGNINGQAYLWSRTGGLEGLGLLPGGTSSTPTALNDHGVVVGEADGLATVTGDGLTFTCLDVPQGFQWTRSGGMTGLGLIMVGNLNPCEGPTSIVAYANAINEEGKVVGTMDWSSETYIDAFGWTNPTEGIFFLPAPPDAFLDEVNGINIRGQMAGVFGCCAAFIQGHALFWNNKVLSDLGTLGGSDEDFEYCSDARAINDVAQIVGWSTTIAGEEGFSCPAIPSEVPHAFSWTKPGGMKDLGTLPGDRMSMAYANNIFGQVVGTSGNSTMQPQYRDAMGAEVVGRPFIWTQKTGMQDLNTLIPSGSGWILKTANAINVWGQIVGSGIYNGRTHGFLLTPKL